MDMASYVDVVTIIGFMVIIAPSKSLARLMEIKRSTQNLLPSVLIHNKEFFSQTE